MKLGGPQGHYGLGDNRNLEASNRIQSPAHHLIARHFTNCNLKSIGKNRLGCTED
jgi:hypothetical protein